MSSVQNNHGLTINIYNAPPPTTNYANTRGLTLDDSNDTDIDNFDKGDDGGKEGAFDSLPLPAWAKKALKNMFGDAGSNLPSSADAAKTLRDFQKQNDIGLLSSEQVQQMADTGYCKMPNGDEKLVPPEIQAAAQKMMANNGELFKKLETAIRPEHDGLLSAADYDAALKDGSIGKPGTPDAPTERVLDMAAFLKFVMDGTISSNRPTEYNAAKTIQGFQQDNDIKHLNIDQVKQMADTGYCTLGNGKTIQVPPEVQAAAQKMTDNNAELFKKLETAIRKEADGLLSTQDVDQAAKDGLLKNSNDSTVQQSDNDAQTVDEFLQQLANDLRARGELDDQGNLIPQNNLPANNGSTAPATAPNNTAPANGADTGPATKSEVGALDTMSAFHENVLGDEMLSRDKVKQMAETGKLTKDNGVTIDVPKDVQESAKTMMANNGALFDKLEVAHNGKKDGLVSMADYKPARAQAVNEAVNTMVAFQKSELKGDFLTEANMKEIAETGHLTKNDGSKVEVPAPVLAAAKAYMDNDGKMFKDAESWQDNKHDNKLSVKDSEKYAAAAAA
jgi:DNA replication initiation complex subunit (GINS family)